MQNKVDNKKVMIYNLKRAVEKRHKSVKYQAKKNVKKK